MSDNDVRLGFNGHFEEKKMELATGDPPPYDPSRKFRLLGTRVPRLDGRAKATGEARYSIDVLLPGMLYGRILRSPHAAAKVVEVDLAAARKMPGVRAALAIAEPGGVVRFAGQEIAALAAETPEQAEDALRAIRVQYAPRPFVVDPVAARKADAPLVFEGEAQTRTSAGDAPGGAAPLPRQGNVQGPRATSKGDVEEGFRKAHAVVEGTYVTQVQTHSALETHGLVARWEGEELTVWASTQGIFSVRDELAQSLSVPASKVRVHCDYMGGGFGAKFGARVEGVTAARLAREAGAPVKLFLDRKEEQLATGNRPAAIQWIKAGATRDGKLTALHVVVHGSGGTNGNTGTTAPAKNVYACDNIKTEEYDVFTNAGPSTAMRAPGHPQGAFVLESAMDELAARIGMDPLEFRMKNDPSEIRR
ncbi:MAG TPA: molybdopterin cofactor-binding domain-containing protein, partial [Thermoanaerobaculia bacterium]|nr:molybdopterin cofactor-binding domain-containing protein [Thermoanaerobaculia bacterium]